MLNCTVSNPTQLGVPEGASGAVLGALEGHYVFMCWAPSFLPSARARVTRTSESKRGRSSSHLALRRAFIASRASRVPAFMAQTIRVAAEPALARVPLVARPPIVAVCDAVLPV